MQQTTDHKQIEFNSIHYNYIRLGRPVNAQDEPHLDIRGTTGAGYERHGRVQGIFFVKIPDGGGSLFQSGDKVRRPHQADVHQRQGGHQAHGIVCGKFNDGAGFGNRKSGPGDWAWIVSKALGKSALLKGGFNNSIPISAHFCSMCWLTSSGSWAIAIFPASFSFKMETTFSTAALFPETRCTIPANDSCFC